MLLFQPIFVLVFFVCVRCADLSITYAIGHSVIRAIAYGIVALLALISLILMIGVH